MSIISNENRTSPDTNVRANIEPLPECINYGEWRAVPGRAAQSGSLYWDVYRGANERYGTFWEELSAQSLREILRALDRSHTIGKEEARREIRSALGVICQGR